MIFNVKDLGRSPGSMRTIEEHVPAPKDFGVVLIGVQEGSPVELDLRLEAVHEGILVSGTADVEIVGECGRCLDPIRYGSSIDVQELFYYDDVELSEGDELVEEHRVDRDSIDLEPVLRDAVVTSLPFQPVCREDCEGLCSECGARLADDPDHQHEILDPRWSALTGLAGTAASSDAAASTESVEREES
ncbi:YceD family protein [Arthrobacter sp. TMN-50]